MGLVVLRLYFVRLVGAGSGWVAWVTGPRQPFIIKGGDGESLGTGKGAFHWSRGGRGACSNVWHKSLTIRIQHVSHHGNCRHHF